MVKSQVERYRSPVSESNATTIFPSFSGLPATRNAAHTAAPDDIPASIPDGSGYVLVKPFHLYDTLPVPKGTRLKSINAQL